MPTAYDNCSRTRKYGLRTMDSLKYLLINEAEVIDGRTFVEAARPTASRAGLRGSEITAFTWEENKVISKVQTRKARHAESTPDCHIPQRNSYAAWSEGWRFCLIFRPRVCVESANASEN